MATSTIVRNVRASAVANNLTTSTAGKVLDARQGKALNDVLNTAKVTNTGTLSAVWCFAYIISGLGVMIPISSGKTVSITKVELFNTSGAWVTATNPEVTSYTLHRFIKATIPSGFTSGQVVLARITGTVS